jgi:hypothetical protein
MLRTKAVFFKVFIVGFIVFSPRIIQISFNFHMGEEIKKTSARAKNKINSK